MKVLIAVASRHGATREIADAIAEVLEGSGFDVHVADPDDVETVDEYGAVLLGSAVYVGRWAASARAFSDRFVAQLNRRPVWLFSSGPVGTPPAPAGDAEEVPSLIARLHAKGHRSFPGRLDRSGLALAERAVVALVQAENGDFRRWREVQDWALQVSQELHAQEIRQVRLTL
ncbi:flavodoxin domain-containing protein [Actinotalea sp.]|uniref:flavodoxin domain-containing protein n=1 Tax=Actinotalea sp. TaxID=1872145 RepID=UPI0035689D10